MQEILTYEDGLGILHAVEAIWLRAEGRAWQGMPEPSVLAGRRQAAQAWKALSESYSPRRDEPTARPTTSKEGRIYLSTPRSSTFIFGADLNDFVSRKKKTTTLCFGGLGQSIANHPNSVSIRDGRSRQLRSSSLSKEPCVLVVVKWVGLEH